MTKLLRNLFGFFRRKSQARSSRDPNRLLLSQLEPRILYSGSPAPVEGPVENAAESPEAADVAEVTPASSDESSANGSAQQPVALVTYPGAPAASEDLGEGTAGSANDESQASAQDATGDNGSGGNSEVAGLNGTALTQEDLSPLIDEAVNRWVATGLSQEQIETLGQITYQIQDLDGNALGASEGLVITIDPHAAGQGWFIDSTPAQDEEFSPEAGSATRLSANAGQPAAQGVDLLSVLMHEQGHILGLDGHDSVDSVMFGVVDEGGRRLPAEGEADEAIAGSLEGIHHAGTPETEVSLDAAGNLVITDINGGNSADNLTLAVDGSDLVISDSTLPLSTAGAGVGNLSMPDMTTVRVALANVTSITINTLGGTDVVTIADALSVNSGNGDLAITAETIHLNGGAVTATNQTYNGNVVLGAGTTLTANNDVTFNGAVDSDGTARALQVDTFGDTEFNGDVGGSSALASINSSGATGIGTGTVGSTTSITILSTGNQSYGSGVTLGLDAIFGSSADVNFVSRVDSETGSSARLTVNAGGSTFFRGTVGGLEALASLSTNASGTTEIRRDVTTTGDQTYQDVVTISTFNVELNGGNLRFDDALTLNMSLTVNGTTIAFADTVNGSFALTTTSTGATTFVGEIGGATPLTSLIATMGSGLNLDVNVTTTGNQSFTVDEDFTLGAGSTLDAAGASIAVLFAQDNTSNRTLRIEGDLIAGGGATFEGGTGNDVFEITPSTTAEINVDGNDPSQGQIDGGTAEPLGDRLELLLGGGAVVVPGPLALPSDTITFSSGHQPVNYEELEAIGEGIYYDFSSGAFAVAEGNTTATTNVVTVTRSGDTSGASSVDVVLTAGATNPATPGTDFTAGPITVNFAAGETSQTVPIEILGETLIESNETIDLSFTNFSGNGQAAGVTQPTATLTLTDDDSPTANVPSAPSSGGGTSGANPTQTTIPNLSTPPEDFSSVLNQIERIQDQTGQGTIFGGVIKTGRLTSDNSAFALFQGASDSDTIPAGKHHFFAGRAEPGAEVVVRIKGFVNGKLETLERVRVTANADGVWMVAIEGLSENRRLRVVVKEDGVRQGAFSFSGAEFGSVPENRFNGRILRPLSDITGPLTPDSTSISDTTRGGLGGLLDEL